MNPSLLLAVAAGGAAGAVARYAASLWIQGWAGAGFPWATLAINVAGSILMGMLVEGFAQIADPGGAARAFLTIGVLGAFTTFSTFSLEVVSLAQRGDAVAAAAYVAASLAFCILGLFLGLSTVRLVAS